MTTLHEIYSKETLLRRYSITHAHSVSIVAEEFGISCVVEMGKTMEEVVECHVVKLWIQEAILIKFIQKYLSIYLSHKKVKHFKLWIW